MPLRWGKGRGDGRIRGCYSKISFIRDCFWKVISPGVYPLSPRDDVILPCFEFRICIRVVSRPMSGAMRARSQLSDFTECFLLCFHIALPIVFSPPLWPISPAALPVCDEKPVCSFRDANVETRLGELTSDPPLLPHDPCRPFGIAARSLFFLFQRGRANVVFLLVEPRL